MREIRGRLPGGNVGTVDSLRLRLPPPWRSNVHSNRWKIAMDKWGGNKCASIARQ